MITIIVLGIDPYLLRQISKDMTSKLAKIYEISEDEINFFAPDGLLVHNGVEQNLWNIIVRVNGPKNTEILQKQILKVLKDSLSIACCHMSVEFMYYDLKNRFVYLDETTPRYMDEKNTVEIEDEEEDECFEEEDNLNNKDEEPYLGNAFEDFDKKVGDK